MGRWNQESVAWDEFDRALVDPNIVPIIKAASLVEANARDYGVYLCNVFHDDARIQKAIMGWVGEETLHGQVLSRWAGLADPGFDFERAFARFTGGFRLPLEADVSVRGSRAGELIARCMVETGTSSFYKALGDATQEPVLRAICREIENDELAHYELFRSHLERYLHKERRGYWQRLRVAFSRIVEAEDDELAYAYYTANMPDDAPYNRARCAMEYARGTLAYVAPDHFERAVGMFLQPVVFTRGSAILRRFFSRLLWLTVRVRVFFMVRQHAATAS